MSLKENMSKMGVAFDANNVVPKISSKKDMVKEMKKKKGLEVDENEEDGVRRKSEVIAKLEVEAKYEAKQTFRFTPTQVEPFYLLFFYLSCIATYLCKGATDHLHDGQARRGLVSDGEGSEEPLSGDCSQAEGHGQWLPHNLPTFLNILAANIPL